MLKRGAGSKSSYSPYSTHRRLKKVEHKDKSKLDLLPNRPNVWLKQLSVLQDHPSTGIVETPSCELSPCGPHSPSLSCPGSPSTMSTKTVSCSSPAPLALQSWVFNKGLGRGVAPQDGPEGSFSEVKDISSLLRHVARFAQAVEKLKDVVQAEDMLANRRPLAHECLGETLRILRQVIASYPLLNTVEMLTAAGQLISKVKEFQYESKSEADKKDFEKAIETMAVAFSSSISELLMGEADSGTLLSLPPKERSRSLEDVQGELQCHAGALRNADPQECMLRCKEVDVILQRSEGGVESAFTYARAISKYMKDLMSYIEKRMALETEFAKGLQRLCQSFKPNIEQPHMPFSTIYTMALEQDMEQSVGVLSTTSALQSNAFMQPLVQRRQEHDKKCKEIKELWQRERRKLTEAENNLRKAKQTYGARCEEYDRARSNACRAEEEGKSLEKKRRQEEETRNKAEEAEATYRTCIADASTQRQELEDMKVNVLRCLQELMQQCDHTLQDATVSYYKSMHLQTAVLPVHYQSLCESSKLYQLGQHYASYVKHLLMPEEPQVCYEFEPYCAQCPAKVSADSCASFPADATLEETDSSSKPPVTQAKHRHERGHQCHKSWPTVVSDTENVDKDRCQASPTSSAGDVRNMPRTPSSGTMSSTDDVDENDGGVASLEQSMNGIEPEALVAPGPFKNTGLSKAAQTHRLRKLRTPAKCRECDSYVYFQGAECEECYLACHRKCLESLAIQCGHKKLQGRLRLFGRDFLQASRVSSDGIPFIIKKCIKEIERRALKLKGIYRVNGVKTRVEKLCQAFENGKELVELSHASPHDISNVLKLYLRQLPEPVLPFRLYSELMGLAKESMHAEEGEEGQPGRGLPLRDLGGSTEQAVGLLVLRLQELLQNLPAANVATLEYIVSHLSRVAELEVENKMNASNLGIVFGPTLMRPRPTGGTVSLSSLVDYPYQARIVEMLIVFYQNIFQSLPASSSKDVTSDQLSQAPGSQSDEADVDEEHSTPGKQTVCDSCDSDGEHAGTPPASIAARQEGQRSSAESSLGAHFSD